jgi:hypothetical protein
MRYLRYAASFLYGAALLYIVVVWLGGVSAALSIPHSYFALFGREHLAGALFTANVAIHAIPTVVALVLGLALPGWLHKAESSRLVLLAAAGAALADVLLAVVFSAASGVSPLSFPWWSLPVSLAPWLAVVGVVILVAGQRVSVGRP